MKWLNYNISNENQILYFRKPYGSLESTEHIYMIQMHLAKLLTTEHCWPIDRIAFRWL